jgi:nicotinate-nucleotide adenylyltransferase
MNNMDYEKTLIFGGAFNPPTIAHQEIVRFCRDEYPDQELWLMPSGDRRDKSIGDPGKFRLEMLGILKKEIFEDDEKVVVSDFELNLPLPNQTIDTARALRSIYPIRNFRWIFGSDSYNSMPRWNQGEWLQKNLEMLVIKRGNIELDAMPRDNAKVLAMNVCLSLSSSLVRRRVKAGKSIKSLVSPQIADYIRENRLYINKI